MLWTSRMVLAMPVEHHQRPKIWDWKRAQQDCSMKLKIAVFAPIPRARESVAMA